MKATFQMSDLGLLKYYLGLEVNQTPSGITISQSTYAVKILEAAGMASCNSSQIPMEPRLKLSKTSTAAPVDATNYRRIVGSLRYLVNSRPDLSFSVGYISRFMEAPTAEHLAAMKRVLRYVAGTIDYGCCYRRRNDEAGLTGFNDSDIARDVDTRRSKHHRRPVLSRWQSHHLAIPEVESCGA
jgi:hypothetical protein